MQNTGSAIAPVLFGVALLCCGLNSTVTATMAGQIVLEGFIDIKLVAWARRLVTRLVAIVPAIVVILIYGEAQLGQLLILSQVALSLQLPFTIIPLLVLVRSRAVMGRFRSGTVEFSLATLAAAVIIALNVLLLYQTFGGEFNF